MRYQQRDYQRSSKEAVAQIAKDDGLSRRLIKNCKNLTDEERLGLKQFSR